ncbi:Tyrosine-protein kinase etk [Acaryochloris thomasi RCC1774]|uniref:non-specific protein-tyrosine kinase n=1 Tax=Acaryochloris thomasi RCC1774 TaxID=1764569 RepID=A0A2W1JVB9_9CYAN|nr:polysaccharide biosynthesis tyrosine autokinase [Acaryochloris thomasi]PZD72711.1 Tyrosine-protein kinase etk [Acaryochloris thomasi RCC1774]
MPAEYQLEEEVIDLGKYWLILKRRWLPATIIFLLMFSTATLAAFLKAPIYQSQGTLRIKESQSGLTELDLGGISPLSGDSSPLDTEIETILSVPVLQEALKQLKLTDDEGEPLKIFDFEEQLSIKKARAGDVIELAYESEDPEEAALVINTLMKVYLADNLRINRLEASSARQYIDQELPKTREKIENLEEQLRRFKETNKIVAIDKEAEVAVEAVIRLAEKINEAQGRAISAQAQSDSLRKQLGIDKQKSIASTTLSQSPGVQVVLQQLQEVEGQLAVEGTRLTPENPILQDLQEQASTLRATLQNRVGEALGVPSSPTQGTGQLQVGELQQRATSELVRFETERLAAEQVAAALATSQTDFQQRTEAIPALEKQLRQLLRDVEISQEIYANLVRKLQEIQVLEQQNLGNARILSPALIPEEPIAPRKLLYIFSGFVLGSLLAFGVALLLDSRDKSVKTLEDIKALFSDYTMLGVIPAIEGVQTKIKEKGASVAADVKRDLYVRDTPNSPPSEAVRMVQSNLKYLNSDKPLKVIVMTSGIPSEGKSTASANLAMAMAELGQKVLLVDADLRRPVQHRTWELLNRVGLSDVLVGEATLEDAIQEGETNLDVLTAGVLPPNPSALIDSDHMVNLLQEFGRRYRYVIIDSPPLSAAADTLTLSRMADGLLLVVRPGVAETGSVALSKELLKQPGHNLLGVIANGVTPDQQPSYSSYYYSYNQINHEDSEPSVPIGDVPVKSKDRPRE